MKFLARVICSFGVFATAPFVHAGSAPDSTSEIQGYFLGATDSAYISASHSAQYLDHLRSVCKAGGRLWALGVDAKFQCLSVRYIEEGGNGPVYELQIRSDRVVKPVTHALLYSTRPYGPKKWVVRTSTADETHELANFPSLKLKKYKRVLQNVGQGKAVVIEPTNGKLKIFLLPWKITDDGIVKEKDFVIAVRLKSGVISIREARGTVVAYADLDDDGVPELQNSMQCDGT
jgi:hypothetical protein